MNGNETRQIENLGIVKPNEGEKKKGVNRGKKKKQRNTAIKNGTRGSFSSPTGVNSDRGGSGIAESPKGGGGGES